MVSDDALLGVKLLIKGLLARLDEGKKIRASRVKHDLQTIAADDPQSNSVGVRHAYVVELTKQLDAVALAELQVTATPVDVVVHSAGEGQDDGAEPTPHGTTDEELAAILKAASRLYGWLHWKRHVSQ